MPAGDGAAQRTPLADEVLLAHELAEVARPHPRRERLPLGRGLEERLRPRAGRASGRSTRWHGPMVARPISRLGATADRQAIRASGVQIRWVARPSPGSGASAAVSMPATNAATNPVSSWVPAASSSRRNASATPRALR